MQTDFETSPRQGRAPLKVEFGDESTPGGVADEWHWTFGDGSTLLTTGGKASDKEKPGHTYTGHGLYTVTQRVTDTQTGEWDVLTKPHYITVTAAGAGLVTRTITYTYDGLYRLTEADYSSGERFEYAYDAVGNRTAYTATITQTTITTYSHDAANRLVNAGGVAYTWSDAGRLLDDGTYQYTWDAAGRLITVTDGVDTLGFRYDGDGNRLARIVNGTLTTHTLDVGLRLPEVLVAHGGDGATWYLHLLSGVATDDGTGWSYGLSDHLGSERQRVGASGQVVSVNGYRPFGLPLAGDGGDPYGFTGEWWDSYIELLYLRARYYEPVTGRFLSKDTVPGYADQPLTQHLWLYALDNPIRYIDPSGHQVRPPVCEPGDICFGGTLGPYPPSFPPYEIELPEVEPHLACTKEPYQVLSAASPRGAFLGYTRVSGPQRDYFPASIETDENLGLLVPFVTPFSYKLSGLLEIYEHYSIILNLTEHISTVGFFLSAQLSQTGGNTLARDIYAQFSDGSWHLLMGLEPVGYRLSAWEQPVFDTWFGVRGRIVQILALLSVQGIFDEGLASVSIFEYKVDTPIIYGPRLP